MSSRAGGSEHTSSPSLPHRVCGGGEKLPETNLLQEI